MSDLITEVVYGELSQYCLLGEDVVRRVVVYGGRPTFKYTRLENAGALDRLAASWMGWTVSIHSASTSRRAMRKSWIPRSVSSSNAPGTCWKMPVTPGSSY